MEKDCLQQAAAKGFVKSFVGLLPQWGVFTNNNYTKNIQKDPVIPGPRSKDAERSKWIICLKASFINIAADDDESSEVRNSNLLPGWREQPIKLEIGKWEPVWEPWRQWLILNNSKMTMMKMMKSEKKEI